MKRKPIKVGPFTWVHQPQDRDEECWELELPDGIGMTFFCLVRYSATPNPGNSFSGWRLTSGGPFASVGGWTNKEDAMREVVPFLINHYRTLAKEKLDAALKIQALLGEFLGGLPA